MTKRQEMTREEIRDLVAKVREEKITSQVIEKNMLYDIQQENMQKLNAMMLEFKGLVAIVRGETMVIRKDNQKIRIKIRKLLEMLVE